MSPDITMQTVSLVLRGTFNPAIFHPSWFARNELIKSAEADAATVKLVCPDAAVFQTGWLQVSVVQDRFSASTTQESYFEPLRDLVIGTFVLLSHTPVRLVGINRDLYFRMPSKEAWNAVGDELAPKPPWSAALQKPGMRAVVMEGERPDQYKGYIRVSVEPFSNQGTKYGVHVSVNDHYQLTPIGDAVQGGDELLELVQKRWRDSMSRSLAIAHHTVGVGGQE